LHIVLAGILSTVLLGSADVSLVTTDSAIRLPGDYGEIRLVYRNTSDTEWKNARLVIDSEVPVKIEVVPKRIPRCQPADRCVFRIEAKRTPQTPAKRFSIRVGLASDNRPRLHAVKLFVDGSAQAAQSGQGWMEAGTIHVGGRSSRTRLIVLTLVCVVPVIALLLLGTYFKRKSRKDVETR
jgi:hypothetical protein